MDEEVRIAVLTSSDGCFHGEREDVSGQILKALASTLGTVVDAAVLPDDQERLERQLWCWVREGIDVVVTTGGTGLGPRDVMPEVTSGMVSRLIPGIAEAMRQESLKHTPYGMLSRGVAGVVESTLIINFPGSPQAVRETFPVVQAVIGHLVRLIHGNTAHHE